MPASPAMAVPIAAMPGSGMNVAGAMTVRTGHDWLILIHRRPWPHC
jgi:hypothetical protein